MAHIPAGASPKQVRTSHPYHMHDHIHSQPDIISSIFADSTTATAIASDLKAIKDVHLVGIGTSWHAAIIAKEFFLRYFCDHVLVHHSFEFAERPPVVSAASLIVVVTHRGTKKYSLSSLKHATAAGAISVVVTGQNSGVPSDLSSRVLYTSPQEKSSAHTMSFTGALARLLQLAVLAGVQRANVHAQAALSLLPTLPPHQVGIIQSLEPKVKEWAEADFKAHRKFHYIVANGVNTALAYETALKVNETCFTPTAGYQLEQYIHGPRLATDAHSAVVLVAGPGSGAVLQRAYEAAAWAKKVGADVTVILQSPSSDAGAIVDKLQHAFRFILLPPVPDEAFAPFSAALVLQLYTYWKAIAASTNPDEFRADNPLYKAAESEICGL